ncbi:MAG: dihydrodipicolinate synthase family protein [Verrucomicrobia bacterium]|nr:dihydrodipicolinate synthase family protein [Verrucomicrobiota bacterium]
MNAKRYRSCILATCCVPWNEDFSFAGEIFRRQVRHLISHGIRDLYIFGTAGEGYAVSDRQFDEIARAFLDETRVPGVQSMVGVISLSLPTIIERIERARALNARRFQLSLPSWGALRDAEVDTFFRETCGRFPDCEFLHYNLPRTGRIITGAEYGRLAGRHPNLVATKNSTTDTQRLRGLLKEAPQLQHFITECGYTQAAMMGECGLLISVANTNLALGRACFEAGCRRDGATLAEIGREAGELVAELLKLAGPEAHMDGAFDKMFCRVNDPEFPLRLLPPYAGVTEAVFEQFARLLNEKYRRGHAGEIVSRPGLVMAGRAGGVPRAREN